jgi:hypothetical protein
MVFKAGFGPSFFADEKFIIIIDCRHLDKDVYLSGIYRVRKSVDGCLESCHIASSRRRDLLLVLDLIILLSQRWLPPHPRTRLRSLLAPAQVDGWFQRKQPERRLRMLPLLLLNIHSKYPNRSLSPIAFAHLCSVQS